ncbi:MAG TPA: hypothetical protein VFM18_21880 [Methanosarcina sp.]|nr:hypothetical protein [Methanosarcina sp.]
MCEVFTHPYPVTMCEHHTDEIPVVNEHQEIDEDTKYYLSKYGIEVKSGDK